MPGANALPDATRSLMTKRTEEHDHERGSAVFVEMSQHHRAFFDEAAELLTEKEGRLLQLNLQAPDPEQLNAIFRAAHSIKGGAAAFGFGDVAGVTHALESLLDRVRTGEMALTREMVDTFLRAADVLKDQLGAHRDGGSADAAGAAAVCAALEGYSKRAPDAKASEPGAQHFRIRFSMNATATNETVWRDLLADLRKLGPLAIVCVPAVVADGGQFELQLKFDGAEEQIWETMAFVVDPARLTIDREAIATLADDAGDFLEMLYRALLPVAAISPSASAQSRAGERRAGDVAAIGSSGGGRRAGDHASFPGNGDAGSIRVATGKIDLLVDLIGELGVTQAQLAKAASTIDPVLHKTLVHGVSELERNTRELQESVMAMRMMPVGFVFSRFARVVHDLSQKLGKSVELNIAGESIELDKSVIEKISDPLTHLVRNALDHGMEMPQSRRTAGKPETGSISLRAFHDGADIVIEVADDGAGLDRARILARARERGLPIHALMSDAEVWQLIFEPGFSTADVVTDVSGRGFGMDVVRRNIDALGGAIDIRSSPGTGTRISIRLPLTLAIVEALPVSAGRETYLLPLESAPECLAPNAAKVETGTGKPRLVRVRGVELPVLALHELFGLASIATSVEAGRFVLVEAGGVKKALFVDQVHAPQRVLIRRLEPQSRNRPGVSGVCTLGDGTAAQVLDLVAIVQDLSNRRSTV